MPEYLAPGVFMEEVSYRSKSIEGVSTTTTGFVGPARFGPDGRRRALVTSLAEFEATFGDDGDVAGGRNYLAFGVRAFFEQGGKRLYVSRVVGADAARAVVKLTGGQNPPTLRPATPASTATSCPHPAGRRPRPVVDGKVTGLRAHDVVLVTPKDKPATLRAVGVLSSGDLQVEAGSPVADAPAFASDAVPANTTVQLVTASLTVTGAGGRSSARRAWRCRSRNLGREPRALPVHRRDRPVARHVRRGLE